LHAVEIEVAALVDLLQLLEAAFRQHRWLVGVDDGIEKPIELVALRAPNLLQAADELLILRGAMREEIVGTFTLELQVRALKQEGKPMANDVQVPRVELLLLHEYLLSHADLAEGVQQSGIPQLAKLLPREADVVVRSTPRRG